MGDSNHTPAPWEPKTKAEWESGFDFFAGEDGAYVFLADVGPEDIPLIAAAPDLLATAHLAMEGVEIIDNLIASIEKHGHYSVESTVGFLYQAKQHARLMSEAIAKAEGV